MDYNTIIVKDGRKEGRKEGRNAHARMDARRKLVVFYSPDQI